MMNLKTILPIGLIGLILLMMMGKKKTNPKSRRGIALSKKVRKINAKQRKEIPLDYEDKMFVWMYSHPKNNPKGKKYKFLAPIANKPTMGGGATTKRKRK